MSLPTPSRLDYSIIICSFNPDERILKRCLQAVSNLNLKGLNYEVLLIDNNSTPSLSTLPYVQDFLATLEHSSCLIEHEQGLTHARIKGIENAKGQYIVFFDDDNEPQEDYIINLKTLHADFPSVAAWGPGNISVDFIDGIDHNIKKKTANHIKGYFQERHENFITYANVRNWQSYYPYGTGLCVKRNYLNSYVEKVKQGAYNAVGRKGNLLSSGEDLQIVLFCVKESAAAGISPSLKIRHIIPKKRTNFDYLKKLVFGTNLSYHVSTSEIFEEHRVHLKSNCISSIKFNSKTSTKYIKALFFNDQIRILKLIHFIGVTYGSYIAINKPIPKMIKWVLYSLNIKTKNLPI